MSRWSWLAIAGILAAILTGIVLLGIAGAQVPHL